MAADSPAPPALAWLLDSGDPSPRYLTLRDLLHRPESDSLAAAARKQIPTTHPGRDILDAQYPQGFWIKPDRGYSPRYRGTIWQVVFLAELGAPKTPAIARACEHTLQHAMRADLRLFSAHRHSTGLYPCLNGNLLHALHHFGYAHHPTVRQVANALSESALARNCACPRNSPSATDRRAWQPCLWGWVKTLHGLTAVPRALRTAMLERAIQRGIDVLLSHDLARDQSPAQVSARSRWLHPGFPLAESSDLCEALYVLAKAGLDPSAAAGRLDEALRVLQAKQDAQGRWSLEMALPNTWAAFGQPGQPNKWITVRALAAIQALA